MDQAQSAGVAQRPRERAELKRQPMPLNVDSAHTRLGRNHDVALASI
jgi:hypothetical protein